MAYSLRILTPRNHTPSLGQLQADLASAFPGMELLPEDDAPPSWSTLLVRHPDGEDLALLCRVALDATPAGLARQGRIREEVRSGRPVSAARWLDRYLKKVRVLYEIHPMEEVNFSQGWDILLALRLSLWEQVRGILHTRDEGFTNPAGDLILWQYPASATGVVPAAIYRFGHFRSFSLNLASPRHRHAFFQGKIPAP
ncbi:hypothetical protein [Desulfobotulus sp.]|uniref:hypothetical protein n=1 Tax=Desulfobotulus sp. TaxID=1940337 RepID=UPI002A35FBA6|nr:hypothetical protein [Desulfobotulus sp.]MDY0162101.1 hypothetical protein [Desulfobotulus sp.]